MADHYDIRIKEDNTQGFCFADEANLRKTKSITQKFCIPLNTSPFF